MGSKLNSLWRSAGGQIPYGWSIVTLEELLISPKSITVGVMYPGKHVEEGVPLIRVSDVKNGQVLKQPDFLISATVDEEYKRTRLSGNEFLITLVGNPGDCVVVNDDMVDWNVARALAVLRLNNPDLREWLKLILLSSPSKHLIDSRLNTTVQKTLNLKDIKELPILLPPAGLRAKLCDLGRSFDEKITNNRQINQILEQMAQALFKSWFVDFDPVIDNALAAGNTIPDELKARAEQRKLVLATANTKRLPTATQQLFPSEFEDSETGWIPRSWSFTEVKQHCDNVQNGGTPKRSENKYWDDGDIPWLTSGEVRQSIITTVVNKITTLGLTKSSAKWVNELSTLVALYGATAGEVSINANKLTTNQAVCALIPSTDYQWFNYQAISLKVKEFENKATGSAQQNISKNLVENTKLVFPPQNLLIAINHLFAENFKKRIAIQVANNTLSKLRDTLLPKLISGELKIPEAKQQLEAALA
jgi:type I restriction enzyme S subunit